MKNKLIALAVLGTAMLSSCVQEKSFENITVGENEIAFVIGGSATRSAEVMPVVTPGASIELCKTDNGEAIYLEETIEEMNASPATRGIPAYNTNLGKLYETMGVYAAGNFGDKEFEKWDQYENPVDRPELGWRYRYNYSSSPWPDKGTPVDFNFRMPATMNGVTFDAASHYTEFDYTSPAAATNQQDILFAHTSLSKEQHDTYLPNGAPVLMYHALTGVKFRNGHANNSDTKTVIKKVEIFGLKDKGHCVVTAGENDQITFTWTGQQKTRDSFSQVYSNPDYVVSAGAANLDGTVDYTNPGTEENPNPNYNPDLYGTSWTAAAADHNLNDKDGSLTFWFVPQEITDEVTMKVTFVVKTPDTPEGTDITLSLDFGSQLNSQYKTAADKVYWGPGQLRTYSLIPYDVDVMLSDKMDNNSPDQGYVKRDLHITNTGNVDEYIRVQLIGNWYGWTSETEMNAWQAAQDAGNEVEKAKHEPDILVGYTTKTGSEMNERWFSRADHWGYFDASFLQGRDHGNWVRGDGGYYYLQPIGPGKAMDPNSDVSALTEVLFQSYTIPDASIPTIWVLPEDKGERVQAVGVHLVMTISVQAIGTKKPDGTDYASCWEAWSAAIFPDGSDTIDPKDESHRNGAPA